MFIIRAFLALAVADPSISDATSPAATDDQLVLESHEFSSGWPGSRGYTWFVDGWKAIDPATIKVKQHVRGGDGCLSWSANLVDSDTIQVTVAMPEGDAFNPGKHNCMLTVVAFYR